MHMSELIRLRDLLRREFFVCHLEQLLVKSMELARSSGDPLVFYALASVLDDVCRRWEGTVASKEGQALAWVRANKLRDYPMPPADIPLIPHLIDLLM